VPTTDTPSCVLLPCSCSLSLQCASMLASGVRLRSRTNRSTPERHKCVNLTFCTELRGSCERSGDAVCARVTREARYSSQSRKDRSTAFLTHPSPHDLRSCTSQAFTEIQRHCKEAPSPLFISRRRACDILSDPVPCLFVTVRLSADRYSVSVRRSKVK
jgi:hypothetical protein